MKSIIVDIDEKDLKELGLTSAHISFKELKRQILVQSIRTQRKKLERLNKKYGFDKLTEEEIFEEVNKAKAEYYKEKKKKIANAKISY